MSFSSLLRSFAKPVAFSSQSADAMRALVTVEPTLSRQLEIAQIAAPTGQESRRATFVQGAMVALGMAVEQDAVGNLIVRLDAAVDKRASRRLDDPTTDDADGPVVVMAHLDTAFSDFELPALRREGSRVLLPGIGDNSRGLAAMLSIASMLRASVVNDGLSLQRPVELVATVGEEGLGNLRGATQYFDDRARRGAKAPAAVIALDGPGDELVVHHAIASHRTRVSFFTDGGHPWAHAYRVNAIHAAGHAIAAIAQWSASRAPGVSIAVTRMSGGESVTSIPMQAWIELDIRSLNARAMAGLIDTVRKIALDACAATCVRGSEGEVRMSIETLGDRPGGSLDSVHPLVQLAMQATRWQRLEPRSASSSSDANVPLSRGIPAVTIGAGGLGGGEHTPHEWYDDSTGSRGLARAFALVLAAASSAYRAN